MRKQLAELGEKNKMQLEQINGLLLEKVNLQSDSIGQREKMLQRERDFGYVCPPFAYRSLTPLPSLMIPLFGLVS